eukprot:snap_masked-scaffold_14-processed-gene-10.49-mRNA-1 protein AED:1.00 eAED:1.00 QI:0/-1/0/0/-1/1/1/0/173
MSGGNEKQATVQHRLTREKTTIAPLQKSPSDSKVFLKRPRIPSPRAIFREAMSPRHKKGQTVRKRVHFENDDKLTECIDVKFHLTNPRLRGPLKKPTGVKEGSRRLSKSQIKKMNKIMHQQAELRRKLLEEDPSPGFASEADPNLALGVRNKKINTCIKAHTGIRGLVSYISR